MSELRFDTWWMGLIALAVTVALGFIRIKYVQAKEQKETDETDM